MHRKISVLFGKKEVVLRDTEKAVTPFGGLSVLIEFLNKIGFASTVSRYLPFALTSPNRIDPAQTLTAFLISVTSGARRFAHTSLLRADTALHALLGIKRYPCDDTIRNLFKRFGARQVQEFFEPLWVWMLSRLPRREGGYTLDLDSTVFERYGKQEGAKKGYNPKRKGRPSHHPILAVLSEAYFVLHGWLRSGNASSARGVVEFLQESLVLLPKGLWIRSVRADSGFFDHKLLEFLESQKLPYVIVAKMTGWIKKRVASVSQWQKLDANYEVGEFTEKLFGWLKERRFVVIRERVRESRPSVGRKLFEIQDYTYRVMVTNRSDSPAEIWRDYNKRADMENRIMELKYDLAADDFCMRQFYATEAAFRSILMLFNLLAEFQRATGMTEYRQPASLRYSVFLCGAILGRKGHQAVLHMSTAWGGLQRRNPLFDKIKAYVFPTSPKLEPEGCPA